MGFAGLDENVLPPLECLRMNHINIVVEEFDAAVMHFQRVFGAQLVLDLPQPEWHACLLDIGDVLFEVFSPPQFLLNARYGPHYVGIEYQTGMDAARRAVTMRNIRLVRDIGHAIHTHPADTLGIAWEFFDGDFRVMPNLKWLEPLHSPERWRAHPIGYTGLRRLSVAVHDCDRAAQFLADFFGAMIVYKESRKSLSATIIGMLLADTTIELISPTGEGAISEHLHRYGDGIRSTVFEVADLERTHAHFKAIGIDLVDGDGPSTLAIEPRDNLGVMMEFCAS
ncbi:VOC family protein [Mycobacterium sp. UM_CSW]|uniref:VOC family protein n=1 Tax=Mycobacterium sp. UM_CSW TaxID=1370119 RepID=UPI0009DBFA5D|nr:VOC family protein [Mycobacterium sp. UM_CSW]